RSTCSLRAASATPPVACPDWTKALNFLQSLVEYLGVVQRHHWTPVIQVGHYIDNAHATVEHLSTNRVSKGFRLLPASVSSGLGVVTASDLLARGRCNPT